MSERDTECRWTHWAIEYRHSELSMVHWYTMRGTRSEAWDAWADDVATTPERFQAEAYKHRRAGRYRAVKVAAHKVAEAAHG